MAAMQRLEIEWIEEDDDGLDPNWLNLSFTERFQIMYKLREQALNFRDAVLKISTPRRMDRLNPTIDWLEPVDNYGDFPR